MAQPKLALIPATQGSKVFSVLPADGVGDFDFSRNSAATRINKDGLIETVASGVSRLNYPLIDGVVNGCPSHLLEPQRTNLITYSEDFSNAAWGLTNSTIAPNQSISPDGSLNADKLTDNINNGQHRISDNFPATSGQEYTISSFVKYVSGSDINKVYLLTATNTPTTRAFFDIENGIALSGGGIIENYGNGWYRVSSTVTASGTGNILFGINLTDADGSATYTGTGNGEIYIYGAQAEQSSYPTSYIPTTTSAVTRSADTANGAGDASTFNDSEGVLMAEISAFAYDEAIAKTISIINSTSNSNLIRLYYYQNKIVANIKVGGVTVVEYVHTLSSPVLIIKVAFKYKQNDFAFWVNGIKVGSDSLGNVPTGLNVLSFDYAGGSDFYGNTKQIQYFDSVLNDSDLETITSWTSFTDLANGQTYSIK